MSRISPTQTATGPRKQPSEWSDEELLRGMELNERDLNNPPPWLCQISAMVELWRRYNEKKKECEERKKLYDEMRLARDTFHRAFTALHEKIEDVKRLLE